MISVVPLGDFGVATYHIKMSEGCQCPTKKINEDVKCLFFYFYRRSLQSIPVDLACPHGPSSFFPMKLSQDMREGSGSYFYAESGKVFVGEWVNDLPKVDGSALRGRPLCGLLMFVRKCHGFAVVLRMFGICCSFHMFASLLGISPIDSQIRSIRCPFLVV